MAARTYLCPHCGAQNGPADVFCYSCQKELEDEPDPLGKVVRAVMAVILVSVAIAILAAWAATAGNAQAAPDDWEVLLAFRTIVVFVVLFSWLMTMKGSFRDRRNGAAAEGHYGFRSERDIYSPNFVNLFLRGRS